MSDKERAAEIAANLEAQLQGADLDLEISAYAATARASRDRETPTGPSERSQEHEPDDAPSLETIRPTMEAAALKRAVVMRAQIRLLEDEAEEGLQRLQTTVWLVMLPPAFLFIFGATLLWAFWGFRRDQ
jgi:hypothetical protein